MKTALGVTVAVALSAVCLSYAQAPDGLPSSGCGL